MSLLATSFRYEVKNCNAKTLQKALNRQQFRIKEDEKYATRESTVESESMVNEVSKWSEGLEEASERRKVKRETNDIKNELRMANKASIMIRRDQLQKLLLSEKVQYEAELQKLGQSFYQERL